MKKGMRRPFMRDGAGQKRDWFRIANLGQNGTAEIYIYDEIGYWGVTASDFIAALMAVNATDLDLHINSPGGDVYDGIAIYQALVNHPANVHVKIDSLAASAASFIAMAGDDIEIGPFGTMMIHDAHGLCVGNADDMKEFAGQLDAASNNIAGVYAARTGGTVDAWRQAMLAETWYYGQQAVDAGLADSVGKAKGGTSEEDVNSAVAAKWDLRFFSHTPERLLNKRADEAEIPLPPVRKGVQAEAAEEPATPSEPAPTEEEPADEIPNDTGDDVENDARVTSDLTAGSDDSGTVKDESVPAEEEPALDFESIRAAMRGAYKNG